MQRSRKGIEAAARAMAVAVIALGWLLATGASAQTSEPCAAADQRLATTGRGDSDHDGLSNCRERRVVGTSVRDDDSDDDGLEDGAEVEDGTDPLDADSDDDGLDDGDEDRLGTDPHDVDSDDDGEEDGVDGDPAHELADQVEGDATAISCPTVGADGSIALLGMAIVLPADARYEGVADCTALAALLAANGSVHLEVSVIESGGTLIADEVELEDADHDGMPDDVDDDDDGDGIDDDADDDEGDDD